MSQPEVEDEPVDLTIGVFDGVHRGHQHLIQQMVAGAAASGRATACVTFDPDPEAVLYPQRQPFGLSSVVERLERLQALGIGRVELLPFTWEIARQSPWEFMSWLHERFRLHRLWVGVDFALGRDRTGTVETLAQIGQTLGFGVVALEPLQEVGRPISSTWIREAVSQGDVSLAASLLGRQYCLEGSVIEGARRGRQLGFPTANVVPPRGRAIPSDGVYFVEANWSGISYAAVANLGPRPTFHEAERLLEVHVLDYDGELYGTNLEVCFRQRLREVRKFETVQDLSTQIQKDVATARSLAEAVGG
jgi:riboflavin kinase/FMN adenylyltransferase